VNIKDLKETVDKLFGERTTFMVLLQEIAENFYSERADFTYRRSFGEEYSDNLMTSYPTMVRRDLGNQFGAMLRPRDKEWFHLGLIDDNSISTEEKQYFEWTANIMRRGMYDRKSQFTRATKEGDQDYSAFGQCVLSCTPSRDASRLLYRNWHLRDCAWQENEDGEIGMFARRWKAKARDLVRLFGSKVDDKVQRKSEKEPFSDVECYHIVCDADYYDDKSNGRPYWSIYYDTENEKIIEAIPMWDFEYIIPRWQTVSGSQYAFSPATITALPDARLIQSMTLSLLEAGEKATNPPLVGTKDAVKSDVSVYAGGITWVDREYDERLGDALRPISQDFRGLPFGFEMQADMRAMLKSAFYLDQLSLPVNTPEMTAYEVGQRVQEYIRQAMPIFEPMELNYNGQLCELTYRRMLRAGAFGDPNQNMPKSLSGKEYQFNFESPLHDAIEQQKGQKFMEAREMIAEAAQLDQGSMHTLNVKQAVRDSLHGIGVPAEWIKTELEVTQIEAQIQAQQQEQQARDAMEQEASTAASLKQASG
jgi:hypothetical protein